MNNELTSRIEQYLSLDTNYAVIINGNYGIGKTFYVKNFLFPRVKNIPNSNTETSFKPILISLFGARSIEDIQNQIFLELYPILKTKGAKLISGLGGGVLKYFGSDLKDLLKNSGAESSDLIDYKNILLCIDDIDRKSEELSIKEVFGYINNLVENMEAKVLLIANEDELRKEINDTGNYYSLLREKVIGISMTFPSNTSIIYNEIIDSKYKSTNSNYHIFLEENKNIILKRIEQNGQNLRNLIFFFEHFKIIYLELDAYLNENETYNLIENKLKNQILNFTLPISIEYKMGKLNSSNSIEIKENYQSSFLKFVNLGSNKIEDNTPSYSDIYRDKYIERYKSPITYYNSIFQYIVGNDYFKFSDLEEELKLIYNVEKNQIPEKEKIFQKLNYWECLNLDFKEYRNLTSKTIGFVDKGKYPLDQYLSIFIYAVRFNNILEYDIPNLINRFKKGIKKGQTGYEYSDNLHLKLTLNQDLEFYEETKELAQFCIQINKKLKQNLESQKAEKLFNLLTKSNYSKFLEKLRDQQDDFRFKPVFANITATKFWRIIRNLDNKFIIDLAYEFEIRYRKQVYPELLIEKEFLIDLNNKINQFVESKSAKKLDKIAYEFLKEKVESCISNFTDS